MKVIKLYLGLDVHKDSTTLAVRLGPAVSRHPVRDTCVTPRLTGRPASPFTFRFGFAVGVVSLDTAFHISDLLDSIVLISV